MRNFFITNLHKKDVNHFTSDIGLFLRKKLDKPFKKACNIFTNATIIRIDGAEGMSDEEYYSDLNIEYNRYWIRKEQYLEKEYVAGNMRKRFLEISK